MFGTPVRGVNAFTSRLLNIISLNVKQTLKRCTFVRVCIKKFNSSNSDSSLQHTTMAFNSGAKGLTDFVFLFIFLHTADLVLGVKGFILTR